jgi:hypothetical protein
MTARVRRSGSVKRLLEPTGVPADRIGGHVPPTGGTYDSPHRIDLADGAPQVLRVPPSPERPAADLRGRTAVRRIALYRCCLYPITPVGVVQVEVVPRGCGGDRLTWVREFVGPRLEAALDAAC